MCSLRKIPTRLRATNFCNTSAHFALSFVRQQNGPECTQIVWNVRKHQLSTNGVDWVRSLQKIPSRLRGTNFCTSSARFAPSFVRQPKNGSLGSNGVDRVLSLRKIPMRLRGTNFCTSLSCFVPSFARQPKDPESTQIVRNAPKHQFRVQRGGSGAFVAKNSDTTSWHELLHYFVPFCIEFRKATKRSRMQPNSTKRTKMSA